jgi:hypothetical protein
MKLKAKCFILYILFYIFPNLTSFENIGEIASPENNEVVKSARFAVFELTKLSDSSIYETIKLSKVISAHYQEGIFHRNLILNLELKSPYFKSGREVENFQMVVLKHMIDGTRSLAINEFPVMKEREIENFSVAKMKQYKMYNEKAFKQMEVEFRDNYTDKIECAQKDNLTVERYLVSVDSSDALARRKVLSERDLQPRLSGQQLADEKELSEMTLLQIHTEILTDISSHSNYFYYRARHILDDTLMRLHKKR